MYTRHGHHIPGSSYIANAGISVARCGGPNHCHECKTDVMEWQTRHPQEHTHEEPLFDLSFLSTEERRRALCIQMAYDSFLRVGETPSTPDIRKRAKDFEFFISHGM